VMVSGSGVMAVGWRARCWVATAVAEFRVGTLLAGGCLGSVGVAREAGSWTGQAVCGSPGRVSSAAAARGGG
jgi:hypothetical protein